MKRLVSWGLAVLVLSATSGIAQAQSRVSGFAGIAATTTMGDLKDADSTKAGWMFMGGLETPLVTNLDLRFDTGIGFNDRESTFDESAVLWTLSARLQYWLPMQSESFRPYVNGGAGLFWYKRHPGQTGLDDQLKVQRRSLIGAGAGLDYSIGSASVFLEARYEMGGSDRSFIPIMIGGRWGRSSQ